MLLFTYLIWRYLQTPNIWFVFGKCHLTNERTRPNSLDILHVEHTQHFELQFQFITFETTRVCSLTLPNKCLGNAICQPLNHIRLERTRFRYSS